MPSLCHLIVVYRHIFHPSWYCFTNWPVSQRTNALDALSSRDDDDDDDNDDDVLHKAWLYFGRLPFSSVISNTTFHD